MFHLNNIRKHGQHLFALTLRLPSFFITEQRYFKLSLVLGLTLSAANARAQSSDKVIADSVSDYSQIQGNHNWYYGYYSSPFDHPTFEQMKQFRDGRWYVKDGTYWTSMWRTGGHPDSPNTSGGRTPIEFWAVRRWTSNVSGVVNISGTLAKENFCGDGIVGKIFVNGIESYNHDIAASDKIGVSYSINIPVALGTNVDFVITPKNDDGCDSTKFTARISQADAKLVSEAGCAPAPSGLVSWWPGDGNANDVVGGNNGTLHNTVAFASGKVARAFSFNGINDRISVVDSDSLKIAGSLSIEGWIYIKSFPKPDCDGCYGNGQILFRGDDRSLLDPYALMTREQGKLRFHIESLTDRIDLDAAISSGQWKHVAAVLDDATGAMRIYIDGVVAAQTITKVRPFQDLDPASNPGVGIGNHGGFPRSPNNQPFHGLIKELSIFSRALSPGEVQSIYKAGDVGKCKPADSNLAQSRRFNLNGNWVYLEKGTTVIEQSGDNVRMFGTWTPLPMKGPHYEIDATISGNRLKGRWRALKDMPPVKADESGAWNAVISDDGKTITVFGSEDPHNLRMNEVILTPAPEAKTFPLNGVWELTVNNDGFFYKSRWEITPVSKDRWHLKSTLIDTSFPPYKSEIGKSLETVIEGDGANKFHFSIFGSDDKNPYARGPWNQSWTGEINQTKIHGHAQQTHTNGPTQSWDFVGVRVNAGDSESPADARRMADLRLIYGALQQFQKLNGYLPTTVSYGEANAGTWDYSSQGDFLPFLKSTGILPTVPKDPINDGSGDVLYNGSGYSYAYHCYASDNTLSLGAKLQNGQVYWIAEHEKGFTCGPLSSNASVTEPQPANVVAPNQLEIVTVVPGQSTFRLFKDHQSPQLQNDRPTIARAVLEGDSRVLNSFRVNISGAKLGTSLVTVASEALQNNQNGNSIHVKQVKRLRVVVIDKMKDEKSTVRVDANRLEAEAVGDRQIAKELHDRARATDDLAKRTSESAAKTSDPVKKKSLEEAARLQSEDAQAIDGAARQFESVAGEKDYHVMRERAMAQARLFRSDARGGGTANQPSPEAVNKELQGYWVEMEKTKQYFETHYQEYAALARGWDKIGVKNKEEGGGYPGYFDAWGGWFYLEISAVGREWLGRDGLVTHGPYAGNYQVSDSVSYLLEKKVVDGKDLGEMRAMMEDWRSRRDKFFDLMDDVAVNWSQTIAIWQERWGVGEGSAAYNASKVKEQENSAEDGRLRGAIWGLLSPPFESLRKPITPTTQERKTTITSRKAPGANEKERP